jgi:hypothetical protein
MDELPGIVFNEQPLRLWQLCRICAGTSNHMIPIFHVEGKQNNLAGKIKQYLPITVRKYFVGNNGILFKTSMVLC